MNYVGVDEKGTVLFGYSYGDCDDPGCTNTRGGVSFKKKKSGGYYAIVEYELDSDESERLSENGYDEDVTEQEMQKYCEQLYTGKTRQYVWSDNIALSCEAGYKVTLSKKK